MSRNSHRIIVTVIGKDRVGIIANVSAVLAEAGANILDISQSVMDEFFVMIMMVDVEHADVPFDEPKSRLNAKGEEMGLRIDCCAGIVERRSEERRRDGVELRRRTVRCIHSGF